MYRRFIRLVLFTLRIEQAHRIILWLLRFVGLLPGGHWLLERCFAVRHPVLEREVFGVRFPNPVGLAAGIDRNGEAVRELAAVGFGFVEIGTLTPRPQPGNPRPRIFRLPDDRAVIHRTGRPNQGLEAAIRRLRKPRRGVIVGCNIGKNTGTSSDEAAADYLKLFRNLYQYADYFTVAADCDCADYTRGEILGILDPLFDFRRGQNHYRPIMFKVSPDMSDKTIDLVTDILIDTPLDGIVATAGTRTREGMRSDPALIGKIGSGVLSGAPLTRRAIDIVRRIHTRSGGNYPIIGVGGVMNADDARAMFEAGADLIQLCTGLIYEGPRLVRDICRTLTADAEAAAGTHEETAAGTAAENPET